jgi:hypothetical protein
MSGEGGIQIEDEKRKEKAENEGVPKNIKSDPQH